MDRSTKQKISKQTQTLNDTMDQLDIIDIYRTFHPKTMNFTFFSSAHGRFLKIDNILGHKSSLWKLKKKKKEKNHSKPFFQPQWSKIRSQLQAENYYKFQHMEAKQHTDE